MRASLRNFAVLFLLALVLFLTGQNGFFLGVDNTFKEWRFSGHQVPASGQLVFVDIDARSLQEIGQWPWPRTIYADVLDKLIENDAADVAFDIDFSNTSTAENDLAFANALERAGGFTYLAALQQLGFNTNGDPILITNKPLDIFYAHSDLALVNVEPDKDGQVWMFSKYGIVDGDIVPSLPTIFAPKEHEKNNNSYFIDFSIDLGSIDRISIIDLLNGQVDRTRIEGKKVVIGASSLDLGDTLDVPHYGRIPGPLVQLMAAETRLQGRELQQINVLAPWFLIVPLIFFVARFRRIRFLPLAFLLGGFSVGVEFFAFILQSQFCQIIDVFWVHLSALSVFIYMQFYAMDMQKILVRQVSGQNVRMQTILDRIISDNFDGVVIIDSSRKILAASAPAEKMLSMRDHLVGASCGVLPERLFQEVNQAFADAATRVVPIIAPIYVLNKDENGDPSLVIEYSVTVSSVSRVDGQRSKGATEYVACLTFRDITHRHNHQKRMDFLANHDPLTGAFTRSRLEEELGNFVTSEDGGENGLTVVLLDLDRFKNVNETLGHAAGDGVLIEVANRLAQSGLYSVARLGADRFAGAYPGVMSTIEISKLLEKIIANVTEPYALDGHRALIGVSIGATDTENSGFSPNVLISQADMALSEAKEIPGNSFFLFKCELNDRIHERQRVEMALLDAVGHDQLYLQYQPQVDLADGECVGAEALVRWLHPELGRVSPDRFISVAEDSGMIIEIGRWVLVKACIDAMAWPKPYKVAVNVSAVQFEYGDVVGAIRHALEVSGLPVERLDIEITESVFVTKQDRFIQTLDEIVDMGVGVALDDFGTGYSSLSYLSRLPVDKVKIDQSFVRNLPDDEQSMAIVQSVLSLSSAMNKTVVAEGIETADQAWVLRLAGCGIGQGYLFGRPQSNEEFCRYLERADIPDFLNKSSA